MDLIALGDGIGQYLNRVTLEMRIRHLVVAQSRVVHGETVVVTVGNHHILLAGIDGDTHPFGCVKLDWVELLGEFFVFWHRDAIRMHHPFLLSENGIQSPVNEHPEADVLKMS